jgi:RNA polymerase sigma-70 factor, ECF subfamily
MDLDLAAAKKGDSEQMALIVRDHYAQVYRFCARRVGPELGKDAAQETFITAQRKLKRFNGDSSLSTWLLGIAHNHCRNLSRKNGREVHWLGDQQMEAIAATERESTLIDREALRSALQKLSPEHREVVLLHEVEGLTYDEAAAILGVPAGTVKSRLHHAFLNLRKALAPCEEVTA